MDRLSSQSSQSFAKLTTALDESADDCKKYFHINIKKKKKKKKKKNAARLAEVKPASF